MKNIVATHTDIALENIDTIIEYEKNINSFVFGSMEVLSWLVFLFGVINLINTTLSNQMSRKQENSVLRSIGLTQKQLCKMNICEGLCYALFATLATLIVGLPASIFATMPFHSFINSRMAFPASSSGVSCASIGHAELGANKRGDRIGGQDKRHGRGQGKR